MPYVVNVKAQQVRGSVCIETYWLYQFLLQAYIPQLYFIFCFNTKKIHDNRERKQLYSFLLGLIITAGDTILGAQH